MKKASIEDIYEVKVMGFVSDIEKLSLFDLYQPLIGVSAVGLYLTLLEDPSKAPNVNSDFETLSLKTNLTLGELFRAFEALEAVGLIKTFFKGSEKINYFIFSLFSPMDPKEFFGDILFIGTLKKQIGAKALKILEKKYETPKTVEGFEEVSTSFVKFFNPYFEPNTFLDSPKINAKGHTKANIKMDFDFIKMVREIADIGVKETDFDKKEVKLIEKLATLYTLSESQMAAVISMSIDQSKDVGEKVDFIKLESNCRNAFGSQFRLDKPVKGEKSNVQDANSKIAENVKLMDEVSPAEYLSYLSNNHKPASSDLKIVETLALEQGLPFPVINALISYVLQVNNNMLSKGYCEKIGASLARQGVKTALDAMDYLSRTRSSFIKKKSTSEIKEEKIEEKVDNVEDEISDEDLDKMFENLRKNK